MVSLPFACKDRGEKDILEVLAQATQANSVLDEVDAAPHRVDHTLRLLEDLLLHEVCELALHDFLDVVVQGLSR